MMTHREESTGERRGEGERRLRLLCDDSPAKKPSQAGYRNFELFEVITQNNRKNAKHFPRTVNTLDDIDVPYGPRIVGFGRMRPGRSRLPFHSDKCNYMLTVHLPLDLPCVDDPEPDVDDDETAFRADLGARVAFPDGDGAAGMVFSRLDADSNPTEIQARAPWHDARALPQKPILVDTTFPHSAYNNHQNRHAYILLVDVWHPDLTHEERRALAIFQRHLKDYKSKSALSAAPGVRPGRIRHHREPPRDGEPEPAAGRLI